MASDARLRSDRGCSYPEFISLVEYLVKQVFDTSLQFQRDAYTNPQNIAVPCVTYRLISKQPGLIGNNTRELKPRMRETIPDPDNPANSIQIYGQVFDYIVQFDIWASNDAEADQLELRFEQMMVQYAGFLIQNGVRNIYFESQLADKDTQSFRLDLSCRSLRYFVQLEQITPINIAALQTIALNIDAVFGDNTIPVYNTILRKDE